MRMPRFWSLLGGKAMDLGRRYPRGVRITGVICLVLAFLPYYSHTTFPGPQEVDVFMIGKVKGPPERTFFHVGLPWSPWVRYWRVLESHGLLAFNYSEGYDVQIFPGSAIPAALGVVLLLVAWRSRKTSAPGSEALAD